ncbi:MAG: tRNA guanosine(34) transglycosylase Tgt [bacterium]|nr:tRNA guanosine(34) transglycosylase Tgt [Acidimicrobiia bacterium]MCY4649727.1 tRNA guanosine(34) transglycosylase Tgt [bacterium]
MNPVTWTRQAQEGAARAGVLHTPHGDVPTPVFMPVGTRASVKGLDAADLERLDAPIMLANTYHLMLRPGTELIQQMGGLHEFMAWRRPVLTDSGGYQVFSLNPRISEEGAVFRSIYDGSKVSLTPEEAVLHQERLGADIAMVLDICLALPSPIQDLEEASERTLRWSRRALAAHRRRDQALFGIVQGGVDPDLRRRSARATAELGFLGFGIGGLSVGESAADRNLALEACVPELPPHLPRYLMGVGDSSGMLDAIARGVDMFDCVWPTRLARHGKVLGWNGDYNLRAGAYAHDERPLDPGCDCLACGRYTRSYLRHLLRVGELTAKRLVSIHNLTYATRLMATARRAILDGEFNRFRGEFGGTGVSQQGSGTLV